jgi:site-specific recombinase XerD
MNKNGEAPIYLRILVNTETVTFSVQRTIKPKKWDSISGTAIGSSKEVKALNKHLFAVKSAIYEHYKSLRESKSIVTAQEIKNSYMGVTIDNRKKILVVYQQHIAEMEELKNIDYSPITIRRYKTSMDRLENYIRIKLKKSDYYIEDINHSFVTGYESFIKIHYKIAHNTSVKFLKHLKKITRIAMANGWLHTDPFLNIKISEKKVDRGFLTDEDLKKIAELEFKVSRLEEVRDCFLFSCFTGLAHSDLALLTKDNIVTGTDGNRWIKINRKKTNVRSSIPLLDMSEQIIKKYMNNPYCKLKGVLLPVKSNQKMNAYLKEIQILAKVKKELTTHLARHTFATTITLNNDVPIETVSKMLGHSSLATTKIYARLLDKKVGRDMSKLNDIYKSMAK